MPRKKPDPSTLREKLIELKGKPVSLLLDLNKNHLFKESYNGLITAVGDDFIELDTNNPEFHIKKVTLRTELVLSVWEFNTESKYYKTFKAKYSGVSQ